MKVGNFIRIIEGQGAPQHRALARNQIVEMKGDRARLRHFAHYLPIAELELIEPTELERDTCERYGLPVSN